MYGCFDPDYVYGIIDDDNCRNMIFDEDEIETLGLEIYAQDVVRNYLGNAVYGVSVEKTASKKQKSSVKDAMDYLKKNYKNTDKLRMGYFLVIKGNWEVEHEPYKHKEDEKI